MQLRAAEPGQPATAENHEHIFTSCRLAGSPVREVLDDTDGWLWTPELVTGWLDARNGEEGVLVAGGDPPQCSSNADITSSLMLVAAVGRGDERTIVTSGQLGDGFTELGLPLWSRDSARIAFFGQQRERGRGHMSS